MAPTFDIVATAPDRVKADLLAVPVFTGGLLGPGADAVDAALGGTLAAFMTEAGFEAKRGETLSVPTSGQLGAKAAVLVGMGERDTLDSDALRRAGAAVARRASKVVKVATTVLDAAPDSIDRGDAAQAHRDAAVLRFELHRRLRGRRPGRHQRQHQANRRAPHACTGAINCTCLRTISIAISRACS